MRLSPFGVIPKCHRENKWWLILDLSSLADHNINDGIHVDAARSSLNYSSVDHAVAMVRAIGSGALLAKPDIKRAYYNIHVPVHPDNR